MSKSHPHPGSGSLAATFDEITLWLDQNGVRRFLGTVDTSRQESRSPLATWNTEISPDWKDFLTLAKDVGAVVVFVDRTVFRLEEYLDDLELPESDEVQSLVKMLRPRDGEISDLELQWTYGSILMRFLRVAAWYPDLERLHRLSLDEGDDEESEENDLDDDAIGRYALTLANDPSFQAAKTNAERRYAAKKVLADNSIVSDEDRRRILDEAKSIYEVDIKPKQHGELVRRVEELKERGLTRAQIAKQLSLTSERIKNLGG